MQCVRLEKILIDEVVVIEKYKLCILTGIAGNGNRCLLCAYQSSNPFFEDFKSKRSEDAKKWSQPVTVIFKIAKTASKYRHHLASR